MIWLAPLLATATTVFTDVGEVRACTPLDGGDFLVGAKARIDLASPRY